MSTYYLSTINLEIKYYLSPCYNAIRVRQTFKKHLMFLLNFSLPFLLTEDCVFCDCKKNILGHDFKNLMSYIEKS